VDVSIARPDRRKAINQQIAPDMQADSAGEHLKAGERA